MKTYNLIILLTLFGHSLWSQDIPELMSMDDAIKLALENNFDVRVAGNNETINSNNVTYANAGFVPEVSLSGNYNYSVSDTKTEFASPEQPPIDASGAATTSYSAGVNLAYNIFSGNQRIHTYSKLQNAQLQSSLRQRQTIELTVSTVIREYLNTISQYDAYQISLESILISQDRFERANEKYLFGNFSKLELLNAEVDLSNDSTSLIQAQLSFEKARKNLSNAIGIDPNASYTISNEFTYDEQIQVGELLENATIKNADYLLARASVTGSDLDLKLSKATLLPRLDLSGGYTFSNTSYDANFIQSSESLGWNAGLSLSYTVFNGGNRKREIQNAKINMESQAYTLKKSEYDVKTNILNSYEDYSTNLKLLELSLRNLALAQANYDRSQEAFATGQITGIALRESQINLANAKYNLSVQRIQTKLAEVNLHFYAGTLVE